MTVEDIIYYMYVTMGVSTLLFIPIGLIYTYLKRQKKQKIIWKYEIAKGCFTFYLLCLYQITALRLGGIGWNLENMLARRTRVNSDPLFAVWNWAVKGVWWHFIYNVIGNCIWFIPLGVCLPLLYKGFRGCFWQVVFVGAVVSGSIEILQYVLCTGVTDIDDVICNTLGAAMGYGIWLIIEWARQRSRTMVVEHNNN